MTRSFNHIGPGQRPQFVVSSFVQQLVEAKKKGNTAELVVGDVDIVRDFTDVRDVVEAYWGLLLQGRSGKVYNICRGQGHALREIIAMIATELGLIVHLTVNADLIRPADNRVIVGDNTLLRNEIGWSPSLPLETSLHDLIKACL